jgi:hypothetical protein
MDKVQKHNSFNASVVIYKKSKNHDFAMYLGNSGLHYNRNGLKWDCFRGSQTQHSISQPLYWN